MKKIILLPFLFSIICLGISSCKKASGLGVRASVKGKLYSGNYHSPEIPVTEEDGEPEERVYLVFGDREDGYDADMRTNYDGTFEFKYLRKGTYKIYAYGMDTSKVSSSPKTPIIRTFEIADNKQNVAINDLVIYKEAGNNGSATIRGKVWAKSYNATFTELKGAYYAGDEEVYLKCGNETAYSERIRTAYDGSYEFKNLRKGKYQVYIYSEDSTMASPSGRVMVMKSLEITEKNQMVKLEDLQIFE